MVLTWVCWWGECRQSERRGWEEETSGFSSPVTSSPMKRKYQYKNIKIQIQIIKHETRLRLKYDNIGKASKCQTSQIRELCVAQYGIKFLTTWTEYLLFVSFLFGILWN